MSTGLDVNEPSTPEALTLLQLFQGIDVGSHLPLEYLSDKLKTSGEYNKDYAVHLRDVYVHSLRPHVTATLVAAYSVDVTGDAQGVDLDEGLTAEVEGGFEVIAMALRYPGAR
jgi:hypothetical protein